MSSIERLCAFESQRPPELRRRYFALPAHDSSRLSVTAWSLREDAMVIARSETEEEDDDEEPCSTARPTPDNYDRSLSPARNAPDRNLAASRRVSALRPLRC
jgi:hypothetical protein